MTTAPRYGRRVPRPAAVVLAFFAVPAVLAAACGAPKDPPSPPGRPAPPTSSAASPASEEERRLRARLAQVEDARRALQSVVDDVTRAREQAKDVDARLRALQGRLPQEEVAAIMKAVKQEMDDEGARPDAGPMSALRARAADVDRLLAEAGRPEAPAPGDDDVERQLKQAIEAEQQALGPLAQAARVSFKTLSLLEQMRRAAPRLEAKAAERAPR